MPSYNFAADGFHAHMYDVYANTIMFDVYACLPEFKTNFGIVTERV